MTLPALEPESSMFDRAMKMFTPFAFRGDETPPPAAPAKPEATKTEDDLAELKKQMAAIQAQLASLTKGK